MIPVSGSKQGSKNINYHQREGEENKAKEGKEIQKKRREKKKHTRNAQYIQNALLWLAGKKTKEESRLQAAEFYQMA